MTSHSLKRSHNSGHQHRGFFHVSLYNVLRMFYIWLTVTDKGERDSQMEDDERETIVAFSLAVAFKQ